MYRSSADKCRPPPLQTGTGPPLSKRKGARGSTLQDLKDFLAPPLKGGRPVGTRPVQRARRANWWQQANARTNAMRCLHIHQCHAPPLTGSTGCVHSHMHEIVRVARYGCRESNYTQDHSSDWRGSVTRICSARRGSTPADSVPPATDITAHRRTVAPRRTRPYTDTR